MKRMFLLCLSIISLYGGKAFCQRYTYNHDQRGNVVKRYVTSTRNEMPAPSFANDPMAEDLQSQVTVSPNPTTGIVNIRTTHLYEGGLTCKVFDTSGKSIIQKEGTEISMTLDLSDHPNGLYLLQVIHEEKKATWKIIKN